MKLDTHTKLFKRFETISSFTLYHKYKAFRPLRHAETIYTRMIYRCTAVQVHVLDRIPHNLL